MIIIFFYIYQNLSKIVWTGCDNPARENTVLLLKLIHFDH
jgi:hypothetical protein